MPGEIQNLFSHPVVAIVRANGMNPDDRAINIAFCETHSRVHAALDAIEPALLEYLPEEIPEALREAAYLWGIGVDVWSSKPGLTYAGNEEIMNRVINDETVGAELLELRDAYVERSLRASNSNEAKSVRQAFESKCLTVLIGSARDGLRPLGPEFDKRLLEARQRYKRDLLRDAHQPFDDNDATGQRQYLDAVKEIVFDWFAQYERKHAPPEPVAVPAPGLQTSQAEAPALDGGKGHPEALPTPAPALQPAPVVADAARRVVEVLDRREEPEVENLARELERSLATPPQPDPVVTGKLETIAATSPYTGYDQRVSEAYKRAPPSPPKRKKGAQHDLV